MAGHRSPHRSIDTQDTDIGRIAYERPDRPARFGVVINRSDPLFQETDPDCWSYRNDGWRTGAKNSLGTDSNLDQVNLGFTAYGYLSNTEPTTNIIFVHCTIIIERNSKQVYTIVQTSNSPEKAVKTKYK